MIGTGKTATMGFYSGGERLGSIKLSMGNWEFIAQDQGEGGYVQNYSEEIQEIKEIVATLTENGFC